MAPHARGDVAGRMTSHPVEHSVQPQLRLDEDHVLVLHADVAEVGLAGARDAERVMAEGPAPSGCDHRTTVARGRA